MKKLLKPIRNAHSLALSLFASREPEAQYLAALVADAKAVKRAELDLWAKTSVWWMVSEYGVGGLAAESAFAQEAGVDWIEAEEERIQTAGWTTLAGWASIRPDFELDLGLLSDLLDRVDATLATSSNRTRYTQNGFVIAVGAGVSELFPKAYEVARSLGKVEVDLGSTGCKVPDAVAMLEKIQSMKRVGKKMKAGRC